jgi:hypothetical protein
MPSFYKSCLVVGLAGAATALVKYHGANDASLPWPAAEDVDEALLNPGEYTRSDTTAPQNLFTEAATSSLHDQDSAFQLWDGTKGSPLELMKEGFARSVAALARPEGEWNEEWSSSDRARIHTNEKLKVDGVALFRMSATLNASVDTVVAVRGFVCYACCHNCIAFFCCRLPHVYTCQMETLRQQLTCLSRTHHSTCLPTLHIYIYKYMCMYVYVYVCMYACMHNNTYVYITDLCSFQGHWQIGSHSDARQRIQASWRWKRVVGVHAGGCGIRVEQPRLLRPGALAPREQWGCVADLLFVCVSIARASSTARCDSWSYDVVVSNTNDVCWFDPRYLRALML